MFVVLCAIKPEKGLVELFVIANDRQMTAVWQPRKYPKRARIEKIVRGKSLDKHEFITIASAIPTAVGPVIKGKTVDQLQELIGRTVLVEATEDRPLEDLEDKEGEAKPTPTKKKRKKKATATK